MCDLHELQRFVDAQQPIYPQVVRELRAGQKRSHWMWFIFPQIRGLGYSAMSRKFALDSRDQATAYAQHSILGNRLIECTQLVLDIPDRTIRQIFGSPDDLKFRSCMTLFALATPQPQAFQQALDKYFGGQPDQRTLEIVGR
jgi:uncharacterized protein (DUF1810 family)